jgi:two-component sensor histidine kinase
MTFCRRYTQIALPVFPAAVEDVYLLANLQPRLSEWDQEHLHGALKAAGVGLWWWNVETDEIAMDPQAYELWDIPAGTVATFEDLSGKIHPKDLERVRAAFVATRAVVGPYEIDFRILSGIDIRWVSARGQGDDADIQNSVMRGVFLDVTGRKQAEEANELLAGEMSHRVKNLLHVASHLAQITSRSAATTADMAEDLTKRLTALGRAHELARPNGGRPVEAVLLGDLLSVLLQAYDETDGSLGRIRISVPRMDIGEAAATTLALVVHELATNSLKYGALSVKGGTLNVGCNQNDTEVELIWSEGGGPPVVKPSKPEGFGSQLVRRSVSQQLGGSIVYDWSAEGLIVTLRMRQDRLAE